MGGPDNTSNVHLPLSLPSRLPLRCHLRNNGDDERQGNFHHRLRLASLLRFGGSCTPLEDREDGEGKPRKRGSASLLRSKARILSSWDVSSVTNIYFMFYTTHRSSIQRSRRGT